MGDRNQKRPKKVQVRENPQSGKYPHSREHPVTGKEPRSGAAPNVLRDQPSWRFQHLDVGGPYCPTSMSPEKVLDVREKLAGFESMTWGEIEGFRNHFIPVDQLIPAARARLTELRLDDIDEVFSLRLSAKERIFGIRELAVLRLLWWDPGHAICPSEKKST